MKTEQRAPLKIPYPKDKLLLRILQGLLWFFSWLFIFFLIDLKIAKFLLWLLPKRILEKYPKLRSILNRTAI